MVAVVILNSYMYLCTYLWHCLFSGWCSYHRSSSSRVHWLVVLEHLWTIYKWLLDVLRWGWRLLSVSIPLQHSSLFLRVALSSGLSFAYLLNHAIYEGHRSHLLGARRTMSNSSLGSFKWLPIKHLPPGYGWVPMAKTHPLLHHFTFRTVVTLWKIFQLLHLIRGKNKLPKQVKLSRVSQQ